MTRIQHSLEMDRFRNLSVYSNDSDVPRGNITRPTVSWTTQPMSTGAVVEDIIYTKVIFVVCVFGICGNLLNLVVLSQKSLTYTMERMEKSVHYGLIALAVSDFFVCITALPSVFYGSGRKGSFAHDSFDFRLVYKLYGNGVINTFILSSTWLTVTMAVSRYIAVCHPLRARQLIGKRFTVSSLVAVFALSVLFNVPRFLRDEPRTIVRHRLYYFVYPGPLQRRPAMGRAFTWAYFALGIVAPLAVLVYCNAHLVRALRTSMRMRAEHQRASVVRRSGGTSPGSVATRADHQRASVPRSGEISSGSVAASADHQRAPVRRSGGTSPGSVATRGEQAAQRITLTLVVIIIHFVLFFVPAELLEFFVELAAQSSYKTDVYNVAIAVGNLLQAVNFSVNFVLYSAINTHFRQTVCSLFTRLRYCSPSSHRSSVSFSRQSARIGDDPTVPLRSRGGRVSADALQQKDPHPWQRGNGTTAVTYI